MAHKKRKRINKLKRKKAAKQNKQPKLAYGDYLEPYLGIIEEEYKRQNVSLFRWVHYPLIPDDFKPQIFQENNPNTPEGLKIPPADAPKEVISDYTGWFTLSHFASSDDAIREWRTRQIRRLDGKPEEKIKRIVDKWVRDKGEYVVKVDYTENVALVGPQNDGVYKQVFLFEGVDEASLVDKSVEPIEIEIL